jgi:hypothetical protein
LKAGKNLKFETMKNKSTFNAEEIKDNVKYIQGILLLSACKEMHKIQINNIFFKKKTFFIPNRIIYICGIQIISLILQATNLRKKI